MLLTQLHVRLRDLHRFTIYVIIACSSHATLWEALLTIFSTVQYGQERMCFLKKTENTHVYHCLARTSFPFVVVFVVVFGGSLQIPSAPQPPKVAGWWISSVSSILTDPSTSVSGKNSREQELMQYLKMKKKIDIFRQTNCKTYSSVHINEYQVQFGSHQWLQSAC